MRPAARHAPTLLLLALAAAGAGCAPARRPTMTFAEAGLVDDPPAPAPPARAAVPRPPPAPASASAPLELDTEGPAIPPVAVPAPRSIASELPEGPPLDATLIRFASEARTRRLRAPSRRRFPDDAARAWEALLPELDAYLSRALPQTPLLELVRARVTIEAEWEYDLRRFGAAPPPLRDAVLARAARLGRRIETSRALGLGLFRKTAPARLRWPVADAGLSSAFGYRVDPLTGERRLHHGIDLAADQGRVVGAAAAGWVVRAGFAGGHGLMVEVRHPGDVTTRYSHLSALLCGAGDPVDPGQPLGLVGRTGRATGPHLHFEVWRGGRAEDPMQWLVGRVLAASVGD